MRVDPRKLFDFLTKASMSWQISPLMLVEKEGRLVVSQTDRAKVFFVYATMEDVDELDSNVFTFDEGIAKALKKYFKADKDIDIAIVDNKLVMKGKKEVYSAVAAAPDKDIMVSEDKLAFSEYGVVPSKVAEHISFSGELVYDEFKDLPDGPIDIDIVNGVMTVKVVSDISSYSRVVDLLSSNGVDGYVTVPAVVSKLPFSGKITLSIVDDNVLVLRKVEDDREYTFAIGSRRRNV